jgi:hypothetical protein
VFSTPAATASPIALIVTTQALASHFEALAAVHTSLGLATQVLTIETICATRTCSLTDSRNDTAKALKDTLMAQPGLRYVLLGGGLADVPSRSVFDSYQNPLVTTIQFQATFVTDTYFSDFSEWDSNHNGLYAEPSDTPDLTPELAVLRLPFSSPSDVDQYVARVIHHLTAYDSAKVTMASLISNIATNVPVGASSLPVDSAWYFENAGRTLSLLPSGFIASKLYASSVDLTAPRSTRANVLSALNAGPNLVVHSGHAGPSTLITEADGSNSVSAADLLTLTNTNYPIVLSCGCQAGDFSYSTTAGQTLLSAPSGGAIAYLGNVPVGLGLAGGMQFIDELLRHVDAHPDALLGDAYFAAHLNLPHSDTFTLPVVNLPVPVLDANSYRWTQKGVTLFGDPLLPVWTSARTPAPTASVVASSVCMGTQVTLTLSEATTGQARVLVGSQGYEIALTGQSTVQLTVPGVVHDAKFGLQVAGRWYGYQTLQF